MARPANEIGPCAAAEDRRREYVPRAEGARAGWWRVGRYDNPRRRALWVRFVGEREEGCEIKVDALEVCAGREGDDSFVRIEPSNPVFEALLECFQRAADHLPGRYDGPAADARSKDGTE